jgi:hypothetical protein
MYNVLDLQENLLSCSSTEMIEPWRTDENQKDKQAYMPTPDYEQLLFRLK